MVQVEKIAAIFAHRDQRRRFHFQFRHSRFNPLYLLVQFRREIFPRIEKLKFIENMCRSECPINSFSRDS